MGPEYFACVLLFLCSVVFCRLYRLTLSEQAQVILQLTVSISVSVKIFSRSKFPWGVGVGGLVVRNIFSPGPERAVGVPDVK